MNQQAIEIVQETLTRLRSIGMRVEVETGGDLMRMLDSISAMQGQLLELLTAEPMLAPRRIVQIATIPETENRYETLSALCNDGTVWELAVDPDYKWTKVKSIPQPSDEQE